MRRASFRLLRAPFGAAGTAGAESAKFRIPQYSIVLPYLLYSNTERAGGPGTEYTLRPRCAGAKKGDAHGAADAFRRRGGAAAGQPHAPRTLEEFFGQEKLLGEGKILRHLLIPTTCPA